MTAEVAFDRADPESLSAHVLDFASDPRLRLLLRTLEGRDQDRPLLGLAEALSRGPPAVGSSGAIIAVRETPHPYLVFVHPEGGDQQRLTHLPVLLATAAPRFRPCSWADAEDAAAALAAKVRSTLSTADLDAARLLAIPRGGLIAAGLLAYALDVPHNRIGVIGSQGPTAPDSSPVILVDDCLISGVRLRGALRELHGESIVVATLYSHPEVRSAVETAEARVAACLGGEDLRDHGERLLGEDYPAWKALWMRRVPDRYAAVLTDLVAFPWSEPDVRVWNDRTQTVEPHWWLAPPSLCFRTRLTEPTMEVQSADDHPGIERLSPSVVPVRTADAMVLIDCQERTGVLLRGTAAELWEEWMAGGSATAARRVAERYQVDESRVRRDLDGALGDLRGKGMLAEGPGA